MYKALDLLAIIPQTLGYIAYFHQKEDKLILPLEITSDTSFAYLAAQQKLLYDFLNNFIEKVDMKIDIKIELLIEESVLNNFGIKVTKELLEKSLRDT